MRTDADFVEFFQEAEPRLRRALSAAYGPDRGREATIDALTYAWKHWDRVRGLANPIGYLYRVGERKARRRFRPRPLFPAVPTEDLPWVEPKLPGALGSLSPRQRVATVLIHAYGLSHREVADLLGLSLSSVQTHAERGLRKLRHVLGVPEHA